MPIEIWTSRVLVVAIVLAGICKSYAQENTKWRLAHSFQFPTSLSDPSKIGLKRFEDGEIISVNSIARYKNKVYLVDGIFNNVKMIDLPSGKLSSSAMLDQRDTVRFNDVVVFDDKIFASTDADAVYVLDQNLKKIKTISTQTEIRGFRTFIVKNDSLFFLDFPGDSDQRKDYSVYFNGTLINKDLSTTMKKVEAGKGYDKILTLKSGFERVDQENCIKIDGKLSCIDGELPKIHYAFDQVYADSGSITFFEIKGNKIIVKVFEAN